MDKNKSNNKHGPSNKNTGYSYGSGSSYGYFDGCTLREITGTIDRCSRNILHRQVKEVTRRNCDTSGETRNQGGA